MISDEEWKKGPDWSKWTPAQFSRKSAIVRIFASVRSLAPPTMVQRTTGAGIAGRSIP